MRSFVTATRAVGRSISGHRLAALLSVLLVFGGAIAHVQAVDIYVDGQLTFDCTGGNYSIANRDCSGADGNAYNTIQEAVDAASPGDTIHIRAGTYHGGAGGEVTPAVDMTDITASEADPIVITNYNDESVICDGANPTKLYFFRLTRCHWITIRGIEFVNVKRTAIYIQETGGTIGGTSHIDVEYCEVRDSGNITVNTYFAGLKMVGPVRYVRFANCIVYNSGAGIGVGEYPTQTTGSAAVPPIAGNTGYPDALPEADWDAWEGWVNLAARYCTVEDCIVYDSHGREEHSDGIGCRYAIECLYKNNISFQNVDDNFDMLAGTRIMFVGNISFDANPNNTVDGDGNGAKLGVRGGLDNVAHHNILFSNERAGLDMADTERAEVYNNTCFDNGWKGIFFESSRAQIGGARIVNNISAYNGGDIAKISQTRVVEVDYNCVSDSNTHGSAFYLGPNSLISTNPQFANAALVVDTNFPPALTIPEKLQYIREQVYQKLALSAGSPCVDAGTVIGGVTDGYVGAAPDMGALEWSASVVGRDVFYNNCYFDGYDPAANASDDGAIATDKTALLPGGTGTFGNYTSYARGINGVMVDIENLPATPTASDFTFKVGNDSSPAGWSAAPAPSDITLRAGDGAGGSDRVTIIWADNAIEKQWLQVTVLATANTGLSTADTFYFGNAIGETGNLPTDAEVTPTDEVAVRNGPHTLGNNPAAIDEVCDFNRDCKVGPTDAIICRNNGTSGPTALQLITVP